MLAICSERELGSGKEPCEASDTNKPQRAKRAFGHACEVDRDHRDAESILNPALSMESSACISPSFISEGVLRQKYLVDRLSMREIASELACSKARVRDQLLNYNIPVRRRSQPPQDRWTTYGKRRLKGKVIDHKAELRAVAAIKQMYGEGMNTSAIARCLNAMKLPTKMQGRGWQQNTVAKILKREGVYVVGR